jgi:hypothetical protein
MVMSLVAGKKPQLAELSAMVDVLVKWKQLLTILLARLITLDSLDSGS